MKGAYVKTEQLAYFNRDHAWFVAYAPVQNPRSPLVTWSSTAVMAASRRSYGEKSDRKVHGAAKPGH